MTGLRRRLGPLACAAPAIALLVAVAPPDARAADCPPWLRQAAATTLTPAQSSAPAVVLLDEQAMTVSSDGSTNTHRLYASRIGTNEGRRASSAGEVYLTDGGRIRQARGWIISPTGGVIELDKSHVIDMALALNDVYNEARARIVVGGDLEPGSVFGAEFVSEERSVFTQVEWRLQEQWPVKTVRRSLTLPQGWRASSITFNHAAIEPGTSGTSYTWQLADLPAVDGEPSGPPTTGLVPRLAVSYFPPQPSADTPSFQSWADVSRWLAGIADGQAAADAAITTRARELAAAGSEFDRIRAIGAYVQKVPYISIQIGLGRGGGYRPRPAAQVFARNHGDCKDKANLMRAMLAAVGIKSYLVSAFSSDRDYVRETWPSPQQFNHAILAVAIAEPAPADAPVVEAPGLGRLLIVDPTAEHVPVGRLPRDEEGSLVLVVSPNGGPLVRLPEASAGRHRVDKVLEATLGAEGGFAGTLKETSSGEPAAAERSAAAGLPPADYAQRLERFVARDMAGARVSEVSHRDSGDSFELSMRITAGGFAQLMQGRLLVLRPPFGLVRTALPSLASPTRTRPVLIEAGEWTNVLRVEMPAGFEVDELPQPATVDGAFGRYSLSARQEGKRVIVERRLSVTRATVPPTDYAKLRSFIEGIRSADTSPIVFRRTSPPTAPR